MIHLKIDNTEISVPEGTTVLDAAKSIGIEIPSMCYRKGFDNHPSCMVCLVKDKKTGNLVSSCALKVTDGMEIISADDEVREARKEALELLMSDHVGDCEAPCSITCPAGMNIPQMNRLIASGKFEEALNVVKEEIALPYVLGYICPAPCEKACRRKQVDESVSVCILKRFTAQHNYVPESKPQNQSSGKVAIIGAGPAGLAGAYYLQKMGYACVVFDKQENAGGNLRYAIPDKDLPKHALDAEVEIIRQLGAEFRFNIQVTADNFETEIRQKFDAVIIATGDIAISNHLTALFENSKVGISADEGTFVTSLPGVFACGSAIRAQKMAVRAVAQGKATAISVDLYLKGKELRKPVKMFNSRFDKLTPAEYAEYLKESIPDNRLTPDRGMMEGFSKEEAMKEASRCLHCDCRKLDNCKLRTYADAYTIDRKKYVLGDRKVISKHFQHDTVVYEPEKCIKCGLCVDITLQNNELTGLSYVGRGFDVRIDVPFSQSLKEALINTAEKCVEACPTGALSSKK
jgi:NADPH-dependent glutamate synthase beta subunit-like oxidoreductase/ferredoxin